MPGAPFAAFDGAFITVFVIITLGNHAGVLLPTAALVGVMTVTFADLPGRILFAPTEIPVGIMMAAVGAPFFLVLLMRKRGRE